MRDNQLRALDHIGFFAGGLPKAPSDLEKLIDPRDTTQDLELRVRAYLHVNCSVCHVEAGGGNARMELALSTPREKMNLLSARPQHDTFGITNAMLVAPGAPEQSVLLHRLSVRGRGQMPPLVNEPRRRGGRQAVPRMDRRAQARPDLRPGLADGRPAALRSTS